MKYDINGHLENIPVVKESGPVVEASRAITAILQELENSGKVRVEKGSWREEGDSTNLHTEVWKIQWITENPPREVNRKE